MFAYQRIDQIGSATLVGAGPGDPDLITVRGHRLLSRCRVCLYAGSIMPADLLSLCPPDARVLDTGGPVERQAAALALAQSPRREAADILGRDAILAAAVRNGQISWEALATKHSAVN